MSEDLAQIAKELTQQLGLDRPPVQVTYLDGAPVGVPEHPGGVPSVCTFFAFGTQSAFYAGLPKHEDCEIGAFVLGIPPQGPVGERLMATIGDMQKEGYLNPGEEAKVPHNPAPPNFVAYGPLGAFSFPPTGVLLFTDARGAMLATEAAGSGEGTDSWTVPMNGRPMCAILPILNQGAPVAMSLGCTGSRIYTDMGIDRLIVGIRGDRLRSFAEKLGRVVRANEFVRREDSARKSKSAHPFRGT